jgi:tetratricopeptide (TPR) repeat protein
VRSQPVNLLLLLGGLLDANNQDAIEFMRRVQAVHADDFWCNFRLAEMLDARGHPDAIGFYRAALAIRPKAIAAHVNLGVALVAAKRIEEAVAQWELALRIDPNAAMVHLNLAVAAVNRGDFDVAIHHSRETLRVEPEKGQAYAILGQSLMRQQRYAEAQAALARGVEVLDAKDPIRELTVVQLNRANEKMALERRLEEIDSGKSQPQGAGERVGLAELLLARKRYADAVKYYSAAFTAEPKLAAAPESPYRYNAACSAALAAMQPGMADVQQKHREVALGWLREELDGLLKREPSAGANVLPMRDQLIHWRSDPDLAGVRDAAAMENCTPAQREACVALWTDVDAAIAKSIAK